MPNIYSIYSLTYAEFGIVFIPGTMGDPIPTQHSLQTRWRLNTKLRDDAELIEKVCIHILQNIGPIRLPGKGKAVSKQAMVNVVNKFINEINNERNLSVNNNSTTYTGGAGGHDAKPIIKENASSLETNLAMSMPDGSIVTGIARAVLHLSLKLDSVEGE